MSVGGQYVNVAHRMFYVYSDDGRSVAFAICVYQPDLSGHAAGSEVVNSATGVRERLGAEDVRILSKREIQVLSLVQAGYSSAEIADMLCISRHTVSRHRQEIIARLAVRNTHEAVRVCKSLGLL